MCVRLLCARNLKLVYFSTKEVEHQADFIPHYDTNMPKVDLQLAKPPEPGSPPPFELLYAASNRWKIPWATIGR